MDVSSAYFPFFQWFTSTWHFITALYFWQNFGFSLVVLVVEEYMLMCRIGWCRIKLKFLLGTVPPKLLSCRYRKPWTATALYIEHRCVPDEYLPAVSKGKNVFGINNSCPKLP